MCIPHKPGEVAAGAKLPSPREVDLLSKKKLLPQYPPGLQPDLTHNPLTEGSRPAKCLRASGVTSSARVFLTAQPALLQRAKRSLWRVGSGGRRRHAASIVPVGACR